MSSILSAFIRAFLCVSAVGCCLSAYAQDSGANDNRTDYGRLKDVQTASNLKLTPEQQTAIAEALAKRDAALAEAADESAKAAIISAAEQELATLLTAEQKTAFEKLFGTPQLRFNFRSQKWATVLEWMASEAGLSLVMDEPPPGTFNYTDSKDYSPTEAIDLLNGWLLTKGFTLVRRERLLMCLNLKGGLPDGAIPRVTEEELADRGRFEFVSVLLPLAGRPSETALLEIKPLLGTYGKAEVLSATQQILVADAAQTVRTIQQVVEKIPVPAKPPAPRPQPPAPNPELVVYPIQHANPEQAGEVLKTIVNGTLVVDAKAGQISVNAIPAEQAKAKIILGQLESNQGPDKQPLLKLYPARVTDADEMLATMRLISPEGQFRYDEDSRRLVAWATSIDQQKIAASLQELLLNQQTAGQTQLQVYQLGNTPGPIAQEMIVALLPDAKVSIDTRSRSLVAIANASDHKAIADLLEQLQIQNASISTGELKSYAVEAAVLESAPSVITSLVPQATITSDVTNQRLLIVATPEQHQQVAATLQQLAENLSHPDRQLKAYNAAGVDITSVTSLLATLAPNAQVTANTAEERLLVIASADDHVIVDNVMQQVSTDEMHRQAVLKSYPLPPKSDAATLTALLGSLIPKASITVDNSARRLLISAMEEDHLRISQTIAQVAEASSGEVPQLQFYPLKNAAGDRAAAILQAMLPATTITFETDAKRLSAVATKADHETIQSTLAKLEASAPVSEKRTLKIYDVTSDQRTRFSAILESLTSELTGLQVLTDAQPGEMTVWATPSQHEIVSEVLSQLQRDIPAEEKPSLIVYPIRKVDPASVSIVLQELFPDAKITTDQTASRLLIHAKPALQKTISAAIEQLDSEVDSDTPIKLMVYPVQGIDTASALELLNTEVPKATIIHDTTGQTFIVRARLEHQQQVADLLDSLQAAATPLQQRTAVTYPTSHSKTTTEQAFFESAFPNATFLLDPVTHTMTALATANDHKAIQAAVEAMSESGAVTAELREYSLQNLDQSGVSAMLAAAVPNAQIIVTDQKLMAWAVPPDHALVARLIEGLKQKGEEKKIQTFDISKVSETDARTILAQIVPAVTFQSSSDGTSLFAAVDQRAAETIRTALGQLEQSPAATEPKQLKFYAVDPKTITTVQTMLTTAVPGVALTMTGDGARLMGRVTQQQDAQITATLTQLAEEKPFAPQRTLKLYSIADAGPTATTVLSQAVPAATITSGSRSDQIAVVASEPDHLVIAETLKQLNSAAADVPEKQLDIYSIVGTDPTAVQKVLANLIDGDVQITVDATGRRLFVRAFPEDQAEVKAAIEKITSGLQTDDRLETKTYLVGAPNADEAQEVLLALYPDATIVTDSDRKLIVATATPDQHKMIETISKQIAGSGTLENAPHPVVYQLNNVSAEYAEDLIDDLFTSRDQVRLAVNNRTGRLVAVAREDQHRLIQDVIQNFDGEPVEETPKELAVYRVAPLDGPTVQEALEPLVSKDVRISSKVRSSEVFVTAPAEEQKRIAGLIRQLTTLNPVGGQMETRTYRLQKGDADAAQSALMALFPTAVLVTDRLDRVLVATASSEQHETISQVVDQMNGVKTDSSLQTVSYRMGIGDADEAQSALSALLPDAVLVTDRRASVLVATATAEQHETIKAIVGQMNGETSPDERPVPQNYPLNQADGFTMLEVLENLFSTADDVRLSLDEVNQTIVAVARPDQQDIIQKTLAAVDPADGEAAFTLKVYPVGDFDQGQVRQVVDDMLRDRIAGSRVHHEHVTGNLLVTTNAEGHRLVEETMLRLGTPEPREMEVFQLSYLEPSTAQSAIDRMISSRFQSEMARPMIHADEDTQQLWVQASKQQIAEMRTLLSRMGESGLSPAASRNPNLRTIPFGGSTDEAIQKIRDLWPRLRNNPLKIMPPNPQPGPSAQSQFSVPPENIQQDIDHERNERHQTETQGNVQAAESAISEVPDLRSSEGSVPETSPPVVIVPGNDRLTIASDDAEALDQLESLLRALDSRIAGGRNRDFSVYQLTNAGASDLATMLQQVFDDSEGLLNFGQVVMVPDERLNVLIVYASRSDRNRIEQLIEVLDSDRLEDSRRAYQTEILVLKHASASRVEDVIQGVYRAEMTAGGARSSVAIPKGVPSDVAAVLRQINAAASSPLLTVEVQQDTNSLVLKAPQSLMEDVKDLAQKLDMASETTRARGVTLVPLRKTNSARVMKILDDVLD
ncbi:MAG: secretin N-terminal domain-containing protein [Planctomycetaceae bacterium]